MTVITGTLLDNSNAPVVRREVRASLRAISVITGGGGEIVRDTAVLTDENGDWSLTLTPTDNLAFPEGAYYRIFSSGHVWNVQVPASGTHDLEDVLVEPTTTPSTLMVTQSQFNNLDDQVNRPFRLMTYYGIPANVNSRFDTDYAAQLFAGFDWVIFGEGLQFDSHLDHDSTATVITKMRQINPNVMIFGYINIAVTVGNELEADLMEKMDFWADFEGNPGIGVDGIFFDLCGYEFEVPRSRFNNLSDYAHSLGKPVLYNIFDWDDQFANEVHATFNPSNLPTSASAIDYAMLESHIVNSDAYSARSGFNFVGNIVNRAEQALSYQASIGITPISLNAIDYASNTTADIDNWFNACQIVCRMYSLPFGVNALDYSAISPNVNVVYPHFYDPAWRLAYNPEVIPYFDNLDEIMREDINCYFQANDTDTWSWRGPIPSYAIAT